MAASTKPAPRVPIDIFVSGYLLDEDMLRHLCIISYGATEARVDDLGPVDCATLYYTKRSFLDAPWLVPIPCPSKTDPNVMVTRWLIPGKAAFIRPKSQPPKLEYDAETKAYLDTWFPQSLLKRPEFKGIRFIQTYWPRDIRPVGIVYANLVMATKKGARAAHLRQQQEWVDKGRSLGKMDIKLPAPFPVSWHI
ncbi:hypothetical protein C8Q74DRAFT_1372319 [Fomes fomentarius]|nr:hypothetical protein C8Q74DRAFT_1372319 [Fomes fomentarius]